MRTKSLVFMGVLAAIIGANSSLGQIYIRTVPIDHAGNAADTTGYGAVAYDYNIGATEVTNGQYCAFLNAVAHTDTNGLYNAAMGGSLGGITRSGSPGSYVYTTISGRANHPVHSVSFWNATRFANWLHNGQPTGAQGNSTTEDGAYTITPAGISQNTITRNAGWLWAVPSEDEWYKAAYHQPVTQSGPAGGYWLYPTSSNTATTARANYNSSHPDTTNVRSYLANFWFVHDMAGNVWEWNETIISTASGPVRRGLRGGSRLSAEEDLRSDARGSLAPLSDGVAWGFRIVRSGVVQDPCSAADVASLGGAPTPDGTLTPDDVTAFLSAFFALDPLADIAGLGGTTGPDGDWTADDVILFLETFAHGCQ
ncbi:MAG: SUMF1/EgtB/PvdO family nonheme iron enzyme [Phycisphaerales bacterium]